MVANSKEAVAACAPGTTRPTLHVRRPVGRARRHTEGVTASHDSAAGSSLPSSGPAGLDAWIREFLEHEQRPGMVDGWVRRTQAAIEAEIPELRRDEDLSAQLQAAVRENWQAFLREFPRAEPAYELVEAGRVLSVEVAALQLPLETLIKVYRVAQQESWSYAVGVLEAVPTEVPDPSAALIYFWTRATRWIDHAIEASVEHYQAERERLAVGAAAQRFEVVRTLLEGQVDDVNRTSAELGGYPLSVHHTALVVSAVAHQDLTQLEQVVTDAARALGTARPLVVQPGGRRLWAWVATRDEPDHDALDSLLPQLRTNGATVGVGSSGRGLDGFATSHEEARAAHAIAVRSTEPGLTRYRDVELVSLLECNARVDRFMHRVLRDLAGAEESAARLRETVSTFLRHGGNVDETARDLNVHRNTVRYRLGQAETLLGRPVGKLGAELGVALQHHEVHHADG